MSNQTIIKRIGKLEDNTSLHKEEITHIYLTTPNSDAESVRYWVHPDYEEDKE
jgi:hypothetical protein